MRIYKDLFTDAEIISDSYPWIVIEDGYVIEVKSRMVVKGDIEVDVGCGNAFGGKNEDEEEQGGAGGNPVEKVNDLVDAFGYSETTMGKKDWQKIYTAFHNKIVEELKKKGQTEQQIEAFKTRAKVYSKFINSKWDDLTVYTPKDYDSENSLIFSYWKDEEKDEAPTFIYFLGGMKSQKV